MNKNSFFLFFFFFSQVCLAQIQDSVITLPKVEIVSKETKADISMIKSLSLEFLENESDISKILKLQPNLSAVKRGGTSLDPVVRGFRNAQLMILLSGGLQIEGGCPNRMDPVTSHLDAGEIHSVDAVFGPQMLMYGPAVGGVLNLHLKKANPLENKKISGGILMGYESVYDGIGTSAEFMGGNTAFFWRISGGNRNYSNYSTGAGETVTASYQKNYYNINVGTQAIKYHEFQFQYLRSEARDVRFPALQMDEASDFTDIFNLTHKAYLGKKKQNVTETMVYFTHVDHLMDNSKRKNYHQIVPPLNGLMQATTQVDAYTYGYASNFKTQFGKYDVELRNDLGFIEKDGTRQRVMIMDMEGLHTISENQDNLWLDARKMNLGLSANINRDFKVNNSWSHHFSLFGRSDFGTYESSDTLIIKDNNTGNEVFKSQKQENILFSAGFLYVMKYNKWAFELGLTRAHRNPDMNELYIKRMPVGFDTYDYIGNPNLKPELNHQIDLAVKTNISEKIKIGLNLFASQLNSYIGASYLSPSILMPASQGSLGVKQFNNFDKAYFMGGELSLNVTHEKLFVHCSGGYTYAVVENVEKLLVKNKQVVGSENLATDPVPEMPPFRVLTNVQYEFSKIKLKPSVQFQYIHKQDVISVSYNELASPQYFLVDLALEWKYRFVALRTGVENVLNENYYDHLNRRVVGGNLNDKIYEPGRNYFVTVRLSF
ncbi:MAG: hypothetical protein RBS19_11495 [Bacteroidales bacterium]|nr:hypothetical protein [Bacteroidales bacterium]